MIFSFLEKNRLLEFIRFQTNKLYPKVLLKLEKVLTINWMKGVFWLKIFESNHSFFITVTIKPCLVRILPHTLYGMQLMWFSQKDLVSNPKTFINIDKLTQFCENTSFSTLSDFHKVTYVHKTVDFLWFTIR